MTKGRKDRVKALNRGRVNRYRTREGESGHMRVDVFLHRDIVAAFRKYAHEHGMSISGAASALIRAGLESLGR